MIKKTLACSIAMAAMLAAGSAMADTKDKKIALSNNYAGNSWRQAMLKSWDKVTKPAVEQGVVAAADAFTTSENQVTEQAAQIQNLILQGYDAIVINAASPDALNGVVKQAKPSTRACRRLRCCGPRSRSCRVKRSVCR
jgi:ribose transport system substrate-binding protein